MKTTVKLTLLGLCLGSGAGAARADHVFSFAPSVITAPDSRGFSNSTSSWLAPGTISPLPPAAATYNFLDSWQFTLGVGADVGAFVGSLNFTGAGGVVTQGISNLQLNLIGPGGVHLVGWQTSQGFGSVEQVFSVVSQTPFAAGDYALQVRGKLVGASSAYAGTLQAVNPVPLPAELPMAAAGLLLLTGLARRGRRMGD